MDIPRANAGDDGDERGRDRLDHIQARLHIIAVMDYLAENTPKFDAMSVSGICKNGNISRSSFYRLFEDKYDAANWYMCRCLDLGNTLTGRAYNWYDGNVVTLSGCMLMRRLMASAWKSSGYYAMKETGIRRKRADLLDTLRNWKHIEVTDELAFQCDCFAYLESYVVRNWIMSENPRSIEEVSTYLDHLVPRELHSLLADPIEPRKVEPLTMGVITVAFG